LKTWTDGATRGQGPTERQEHSSTIIQNNNKDHLFIFGGKDKTHNYNEVFLLNAGTARPAMLAHTARTCASEGRVRVWLLTTRCVCVHSRARIDTLAWSRPRCTGTTPLPRSAHSAVPLGPNKILLFGGKYLSRPLNDLYLFVNGKAAHTPPFSLHFVVALAPAYDARVRVTERTKNDWSVIKTQGTPPSPRFSHAAAMWKHYMVVFGGSDGKNIYSDVHLLDTSTSLASPAPVTVVCALTTTSIIQTPGRGRSPK
jgi:hypothetical protein